MGEVTGISWCDHTFNPWIGCTKVSPACDGCYAEAMMGEEGRYKRVVWGAPGKGAGTRSRTAPSNWKQPRKWDREAAAAGVKRFVFCASLADVFDNEVPPEWRRDLFELIRATPNLIWLLLTKRPQMIARLAVQASGVTDGSGGEYAMHHVREWWPRNACIGTTVEDYARLVNVFRLLEAKEAVGGPLAFLSCEPLLQDIAHDAFLAMLGGRAGIDWVITGGETDQGGHKARPTHPDWLRSIRDACAEAGVPYHHKQNGEWADSETAQIIASGPLTSTGGSVKNWLRQEVAFTDWTSAKVDAHGWTDHATNLMFKVGKKRSGRLLDGVLHDAMPKVI